MQQLAAACLEVDRLNVYRAGLEAMRRALLALPVRPDYVLVDARTVPGIDVPQTAIVGGDASEGCIADRSYGQSQRKVVTLHRSSRNLIPFHRLSGWRYSTQTVCSAGQK